MKIEQDDLGVSASHLDHEHVESAVVIEKYSQQKYFITVRCGPRRPVRGTTLLMTVAEWVQFCKATFEMLGLPNATCGCAAGEMLADEPDIYAVDDGEAVKDE